MDKIVCVGKNYLEHAKELGDAIPDKPVLFLKPPSVLRAAQKNGETLPLRLPSGVGSVHHECEIVLRLRTGGYQLNKAQAAQAIGDVSLGLDMTLRDRQSQLKKAGHPWTVSKVFVDSAVVGPWLSISEFLDYLSVPFHLSVDAQPRQTGMGSQMLFGPAASVAYISSFFPLCPGDLIFTGTPAGVNSVEPGQTALLSWGPLSYSVHWQK